MCWSGRRHIFWVDHERRQPPHEFQGRVLVDAHTCGARFLWPANSCGALFSYGPKSKAPMWISGTGSCRCTHMWCPLLMACKFTWVPWISYGPILNIITHIQSNHQSCQRSWGEVPPPTVRLWLYVVMQHVRLEFPMARLYSTLYLLFDGWGVAHLLVCVHGFTYFCKMLHASSSI